MEDPPLLFIVAAQNGFGYVLTMHHIAELWLFSWWRRLFHYSARSTQIELNFLLSPSREEGRCTRVRRRVNVQVIGLAHNHHASLANCQTTFGAN
jgi:hypothetical protein